MKKLIITLVVMAAIAASVGGYYYTRPGPEPKISTAAVTRGDVGVPPSGIDVVNRGGESRVGSVRK